MADRRQRIHELVLAMLAAQGETELLDGEAGLLGGPFSGPGADPGGWLDRNRRVVKRYQDLVRSAVTLDAMIDQEINGPSLENS